MVARAAAPRAADRSRGARCRLRQRLSLLAHRRRRRAYRDRYRPDGGVRGAVLAIHQLVSGMAPALADRVHMLPLGIEAVPAGLGAFDTVLSMGILYHRRSPIDHLLDLRGALRPGGQLVLETLVIDGKGTRCWCRKGVTPRCATSGSSRPPRCSHAGSDAAVSKVRTVDVTPTTVEEQRSTAWMMFESLADFLDPPITGLRSRPSSTGTCGPDRGGLNQTAWRPE